MVCMWRFFKIKGNFWKRLHKTYALYAKVFQDQKVLGTSEKGYKRQVALPEGFTKKRLYKTYTNVVFM